MFILSLLALDLFVLNRKAHEIAVGEALKWTAMFVSIALAFTVVVYFMYDNHWLGQGLPPPGALDKDGNPLLGKSGTQAAIEFLTGYIVEYSLSMDNIFVIAVIFGHYGVPRLYQHRVLFWGILGALIMRGVMIVAGAELVHRFDWILYVFGAFLVYTGLKMLFAKEGESDPERTLVVRVARKFLPIAPGFDGDRFITRLPDGRRAFTLLFLALVIVEFTDVIFAVDSIPAIFAITLDPFIVFTSNVFAILGLRSLYFALAGLLHKFRFLKVSLCVVLTYVGVKLLIHHWIHVPPLVSLGVILASLGTGIGASLLIKKHPEEVLEPGTHPAHAPAPVDPGAEQPPHERTV